MEASAFPAPPGLARTRIAIGTPLLRLRSDEQLVALFRDGNNEAFRVIYDRYRQRLFAYVRQMLAGSRQDAEDALQDVFIRAYGALRADDRELALRAWLYRIAHNRCIDELRRPAPPLPELLELVAHPLRDPIAEAEQRESLRRLIADVRRLPEQQRSALLMRELGGMPYAEISDALFVSVAAVKSLLVRARVGLAQAAEARDIACASIREGLIVAHDRGVRPSGMARRHIRDCPGCREFRGQLRGTSRQFAALLPALGPAGIAAQLLGFGGSAGGGAAASGSAAMGGTAASVGLLSTSAGHVATILAAAVVTAGGAVEIQHTIGPAGHHPHHRALKAEPRRASAPASARSQSASTSLAVVSPPPALVSEQPPPAAAPAVAGSEHTTRLAPDRRVAASSRDSIGAVTGMKPPSPDSATGSGSDLGNAGRGAVPGSPSSSTDPGGAPGADATAGTSGTAPDGSGNTSGTVAPGTPDTAATGSAGGSPAPAGPGGSTSS